MCIYIRYSLKIVYIFFLRRLAIVLLEGVILLLFPNHNFQVLFSSNPDPQFSSWIYQYRQMEKDVYRKGSRKKNKGYFFSGPATKALPPTPSSLVAEKVFFFLVARPLPPPPPPLLAAGQ